MAIDKLFTGALVLALVAGCNRQPTAPKPAPVPTNGPVNASQLERRGDGLTYRKGSLTPFTGTLQTAGRQGTGRAEIPFQAGRRHGVYREWHANGQKHIEANWLADVQHGSHQEWYPNGQPKLQAQWVKGMKEGPLLAWAEDGLSARKRVFQAGQMISEELVRSEALLKAAQELVAERERLDQTVWKQEVDAQKFEDTFVQLWDDLRARKHDWAVLRQFKFGALHLGQPGPSVQHAHGVETTEYNTGEKSAPTDWPALLAQWQARPVRLVETEWHQESFTQPEAGPPHSLFGVVAHAVDEQANTRYIVRAKVDVEWSAQRNARGHAVPGTLTVQQLTVLRRPGPAPLQRVRTFNAQEDNPAALQFTKIFADRFEGADPAPVITRDLDGDGLAEVLLVGANLLYRNQSRPGEMKFTPQQLVAGLDNLLTAACVADFNGDGLPDLLAVGYRKRPVLYPGVAGGTFSGTPITSPEAGLPMEGASSLTAGDIDGDGDLDAFITQYQPPYVGGQLPTPYYDANDGWPAVLLRNDGRGRFTDVTAAAGLAAKRHRRSFSSSLVDLDEDGDLDLMVVSDFSGLDLYRNNGRGQFTDFTHILGEDRHSFGMSHALADFNRDGHLDLYMVGMGSTTARRLHRMGAGRQGFEPLQAKRMKMGYGNRLYLGDGQGGYRQAPHNAALARTGWSWGCTPWDFDNDGRRDLYVANGHMSRKSAKDYCTTFWTQDIYQGQSKPNLLLEEVFSRCMNRVGTEISWNGYEHNVLYQNQGGGRYLSTAFLMGASYEFDARSVVSEDLDADGRPDLLVEEIDWNGQTRKAYGYIHLIANGLTTSNHWIGARLDGRPGISPLGAKITLHAGGQSQTLPVVAGDSFNAQHSFTRHFGLGTQPDVKALEVHWPNGQVTRLDRPKPNQYHRLQPPEK